MLELARELKSMNDVEIGATLKALQQEHAFRRLKGAGVGNEGNEDAQPRDNHAREMYGTSGTAERVWLEELTVENVEDVFTYQPWAPDQLEAGDRVREAFIAAAKAVLRAVPRCPQRTRVLNALVDLRMLANAAITWRGRF